MFDYNTMRSMIAQVRADDTVERMDKAIQVLGRYETPGYMGLYEMTLGRADMHNPEEIVGLWESDTRALLVNCLRVQGVLVKEEILLSDLTELAESTRIITQHEDKASVLRHLESDHPDIEVYAEIIAMVSHLKVEDVLDMVAEVPSMFRGLIKAHYIEEEDQVDDEAETKAVVVAYQKYKLTQWGVLDLVADKMLTNASTLALPYFLYLGEFDRLKTSDLGDPDGAAYYARELFGLACLSYPGYENPYQCVKTNIGLITPDPAVQMRLDVELTKIAGGYGK
jgi:hypothetical protein